MNRTVPAVLVPAAVALGVAAEWTVLYRGPLEEAVTAQAIRLAVADFVVGLALVVCGVAAWLWRSGSRIGPLLVASGFAWFLGTFAGSSIDTAAQVGGIFVTLHRGPLVHAVLSYPTGRLRGRVERLVAAISYVAAAIPDVGENAEATAVVGLSAALVAASAASLAGAGGGASRAVLWAYQVVIVMVAAGFLVGLLRGGWTQATVTGLVVELGDVPQEGTLRARLAVALGDPSLVVGYWISGERAYFDEEGRRVHLPEGGSAREVTIIEDAGEPVAALVHDAGVLEDRELIGSVASAARIAVSNVGLQTEIRRQVAEVAASRRRIVEAADLERRRLERELRQGAERRLAYVEHVLAETAGDGAQSPLFTEAVAEIRRARAELQAFAQGIHPRVLTEGGLAAALADLARRAPVPVELAAPAERASVALEAAAYFVCSEALANIGKYSGASRATIDVSLDGDRLVVAVRDDGVGGAALEKGSGLRGLADRVEALGGRLTVDSPPGVGTLLAAELPLT